MALKFTTTLRGTWITSLIAAIDAGAGAAIVRIYTASRPASVATAISSQTLLGTLTLSDPCGTESSGVLTMSAITQDSSADATGTASFFRVFSTNDGVTPLNAVVDGDCGTSGSDMNLNTLSIVSGGPITITSWTITAPGA